METGLLVVIISAVVVVVGSSIVAANAKKINVQYRERRDSAKKHKK